MHPTGLLCVWNGIAPEHEAQFNAWYDDEHLQQRLAVPGFLTARRYRSLNASHAYAALYELADPEVLLTSTYLDLLQQPTPRTRAIMPHFLDMNRAACRIMLDTNPALGAVHHLAILLLDTVPCAMQASAERVRVRLAVPDPTLTGGRTPEQALRGRLDHLPPPFVLVESDDQDALTSSLHDLEHQLGAPRPRMFSLLSARSVSAP